MCNVGDTVGAMGERFATALRVTGSIHEWNTYLYDPHIVVTVSLNVGKFTHDTVINPSGRYIRGNWFTKAFELSSIPITAPLNK